MSKTKKMTFNMIAAGMPKEMEEILTYGDGENRIEIVVKKRLGFKEAMRFVSDIAASCLNLNSGDFTPEAFDFSVRVNTLVYYAGFTAPTDYAKAYDVCYGTPLFEDVYAEINTDQLKILVKAAHERLDYLKECAIASQASKIGELIEKMDATLSSGNEAMSTIMDDEFKERIDSMLRVIQSVPNAEAQAAGDGAPESNIVEFKKDDA